jgi:hypothetical protein
MHEAELQSRKVAIPMTHNLLHGRKQPRVPNHLMSVPLAVTRASSSDAAKVEEVHIDDDGKQVVITEANFNSAEVRAYMSSWPGRAPETFTDLLGRYRRARERLDSTWDKDDATSKKRGSLEQGGSSSKKAKTSETDKCEGCKTQGLACTVSLRTGGIACEKCFDQKKTCSLETGMYYSCT